MRVSRNNTHTGNSETRWISVGRGVVRSELEKFGYESTGDRWCEWRCPKGALTRRDVDTDNNQRLPSCDGVNVSHKCVFP